MMHRDRDAEDAASNDDSLHARLLPHVERFEAALRGGMRPAVEEAICDVDESDRAALRAELERVVTQVQTSQEGRFSTVSERANQAEGDFPPRELGDAVCPECRNLVPLARGDRLACGVCGCAFQIDRDSTLTLGGGQPRRLAKFELLNEVGRGAFGTVYRARDLALERIVAVKVPRGGRIGSADAEDRFAREARAAAQLRHAGIVPVFEVGRSDDCPYIVSEFVEGLTLADTLTGKRFPPREAADLVAQIAYALDHAHRMGVVHRDLKPSNVMLERLEPRDTNVGDSGVSSSGATRRSGTETASSSRSRGNDVRPRITELEFRPRIMDFGLARRDEGEVTVTMDGQVLGTPAYMSPEQARGEGHDVDARSDTYSLGAILYELLTGELPFRGNKPMMLHQVIHDEPAPPRRLNNRLPRDLETICLKCLAKEPSRRYSSSRELAEDLDRFLRDQPILARPTGRVERFWRWCRREPWIAGLSAAILLTLTSATFVSTIAFTRAAASAKTAKENAQQAERREREAKVAESQAQLERGKARNAQTQAEREAETSRRTADFLASLIGSGDPFALDQFGVTGMRQTGFRLPSENIDELTVKVLLERGEVLLRRELRDHPLVRAQLLQAIGNSWHGLGLYDKAEPLFREAIELFAQSQLAERDRELRVADVQFNLAWLLADRGRLVDAGELFQRVVTTRRKHLQEDDHQVVVAYMGALAVLAVQDRPQVVDVIKTFAAGDSKFAKAVGAGFSLMQNAKLLREQGKRTKHVADFEAAEKVYRELLTLAESLAGREHVATALVLGDMAGLFRERGNYLEADKCITEALAIGRRILGAHPKMIEPLEVYGQLLEARGDYELAIACFRDAIAIVRKHYPDRTGQVSKLTEWIGNVERQRGDLAAAIAAYREALRLHDDPARALACNLRIAESLLEIGDPLQAVETYDRECAPRLDAAPPFMRAAEAETCCALLRAAGRADDANRVFEDSLNIARAELEVPNKHVWELHQIGLILRRNREWDAVLRAWRGWAKAAAEWHLPDHPEAAGPRLELAAALRTAAEELSASGPTGRASPEGQHGIVAEYRAEARRECEAALEIQLRQRGESDWFTTRARLELARIMAAQGEGPQARALAELALAAARRRFPKENQLHEHPLIASALRQAAAAHAATGDWEQALNQQRESLAACRGRFPAAHPLIWETAIELAELHRKAGDAAGESAVLAAAIQARRDGGAAETWQTAELEQRLGVLRLASQDYSAAEELLVRALSIVENAWGTGHQRTQEAMTALVALYEARGDAQRAAEYQRRLTPSTNSTHERQ